MPGFAMGGAAPPPPPGGSEPGDPKHGALWLLSIALLCVSALAIAAAVMAGCGMRIWRVFGYGKASEDEELVDGEVIEALRADDKEEAVDVELIHQESLAQSSYSMLSSGRESEPSTRSSRRETQRNPASRGNDGGGGSALRELSPIAPEIPNKALEEGRNILQSAPYSTIRPQMARDVSTRSVHRKTSGDTSVIYATGNSPLVDMIASSDTISPEEKAALLQQISLEGRGEDGGGGVSNEDAVSANDTSSANVEVPGDIATGSKAKLLQESSGSAQSFASTSSLGVEISEDCIETFELLGKGAFGEVLRGLWKSRDLQVAVKRVPLANLEMVSKEEVSDSCIKEAAVLVKLNHAHVITFYGVARNGNRLSLIMELMTGGSLHNLLHEESVPLTRAQRLRLSVEIASGISYLHSQKIIHRDLKAPNILLDDSLHAKVSDFGLAFTMSTIKSAAKSVVGTPGFMAPEVLSGNRYRTSADIWSFGALLYEVVTGNKAYGDYEFGAQILTAVLIRREMPEITQIEDDVDESLANLVEKCCKFNESERPTIGEILPLLEGLLTKVLAQEDGPGS